MKIFLDNFKNNKMLLWECLLELINFLINIIIFNVGFKFLWNDEFNNLKILYFFIMIKIFVYVYLYYLHKRKQILHGLFKNKVRLKFMESIFIKKRIEDPIHTSELAMDLWMGVEWLGVYYFEAFPSFASKLINLFFMVFYMLFINKYVALLFVLSMVMLIIVEKFFSATISELVEKESRRSKEYSKMSMEALRGAETLKSLNAVSSYNNKLKKMAELLKIASMKFVLFTTLSQSIKDIVLMTLKIISLIFMLSDFIRFGTGLNTVFITIFILFNFYKNINLLHGSFLKMSKAKIYRDKIRNYINSSEKCVQINGLGQNNFNSGNIIYARDLSFKYPEKKVNVLEDINLNIKQGNKLALIGDSGSGKSTIIKCLSGFLRDFTGEVYIFGLDISKKENLKEVKENMSVIWQKNHIFNDTVFENIRISRKNAGEKDVIDALKKANIYDFIKTLPNNIHTYIGNGGFELSGGQKSRIATARAFLRNASIILLDEPTGELDRENEFEIISNLKDLYKGRTIVQTAHRLETIKEFDEICFMQDGKIIYSGKHEQLLEYSDEYRKYFNKMKGKI